MNKELFKLLKFRKEPLSIEYLSDLESKYGYKLPPLFKSFISVFMPYYHGNLVLNEKTSKLEAFMNPIYPRKKKDVYDYNDDCMSFLSFMEPEEILKFEREYDDWTGDVLYIANHAYHGGLMVGISDSNKDIIYHSSDTTEVNFVANNIFEYLSKVQLVQVFYQQPDLKLESLYKNWGEDFWRIREDETI